MYLSTNTVKSISCWMTFFIIIVTNGLDVCSVFPDNDKMNTAGVTGWRRVLFYGSWSCLCFFFFWKRFVFALLLFAVFLGSNNVCYTICNIRGKEVIYILILHLFLPAKINMNSKFLRRFIMGIIITSYLYSGLPKKN